MKANLHRARVRRAEDDAADRGGLVVHVADAGVQPLLVEGGGPEQADLLFRREEQLDAPMRSVLGEHTACTLEHRRDGRFVVGPENRAGSVSDHSVVVDHGLDRRRGRHGVEMSAQEDRSTAVRRLQAAVEIADVRAHDVARLILVDGEAEVAQVADNRIGDCTFVARRARQSSQFGEEVDDLGSHRGILVTTRPTLWQAPSARASG